MLLLVERSPSQIQGCTPARPGAAAEHPIAAAHRPPFYNCSAPGKPHLETKTSVPCLDPSQARPVTLSPLWVSVTAWGVPPARVSQSWRVPVRPRMIKTEIQMTIQRSSCWAINWPLAKSWSLYRLPWLFNVYVYRYICF